MEALGNSSTTEDGKLLYSFQFVDSNFDGLFFFLSNVIYNFPDVLAENLEKRVSTSPVKVPSAPDSEIAEPFNTPNRRLVIPLVRIESPVKTPRNSPTAQDGKLFFVYLSLLFVDCIIFNSDLHHFLIIEYNLKFFSCFSQNPAKESFLFTKSKSQAEKSRK